MLKDTMIFKVMHQTFTLNHDQNCLSNIYAIVNIEQYRTSQHVNKNTDNFCKHEEKLIKQYSLY